MTVSDCAEKYGVKPLYIYTLINSGLLQAWKKTGGWNQEHGWQIKEEDAKRVLASNDISVDASNTFTEKDEKVLNLISKNEEMISNGYSYMAKLAQDLMTVLNEHSSHRAADIIDQLQSQIKITEKYECIVTVLKEVSNV